MPHRKSHVTIALALAVSLGGSAAYAQDADTVGERLKSVFREQGVELHYGSISGDSSEMTLDGVTIKPAGETEALPLGAITLNEVSEDGDTIVVGSLSMDSHSVKRDGLDVSIEGIEITELSLPPAGSDEVPIYERAVLDSLRVSSGDKDVFTLNDMSVDVTPPEDGGTLEFTGSADSFTADLTTIQDPNTQRVLQELGYQTISGSLEMAGSWNPADGRTRLSTYELGVEDAGTIGISLDIGGYTTDFQKALRETQARIASAGEQDSAAGMAMMGLMQQLTFHGATIRFEDQTLTGKVLDYFARQQGAQRSDIANQAKAILPFMLAQLNNPQLAAQVSAAASAFLDAPESLTISAMPASPVPFALIAAGAMSAPQSLPEQLGVTVSAND